MRSIAVCSVAALVLGAASVAQASPPGAFDDIERTLDPGEYPVRDRADLLNLIHLYSHLADGLHTEQWGHFFTEDAVFSVVYPKPGGGVQEAEAGTGRAAIVAMLKQRHAKFRSEKVQRRHFITNPVVLEQDPGSAVVAAYLQLMSSTAGGPARSVGTGRYEGRAVKTPKGWRMAEWTFYSDQAFPEAPQPAR